MNVNKNTVVIMNVLFLIQFFIGILVNQSLAEADLSLQGLSIGNSTVSSVCNSVSHAINHFQMMASMLLDSVGDVLAVVFTLVFF